MLCDSTPHAPRRLIVRVGARRAGGAEHADRRPELGERPEPVDELGLDAQHTPRIHVEPIGLLIGFEQVGRSVVVRNHRAAQNHRAPVIGVAQRRCILLNAGDGGAYRRVTRLPPGGR